MYNKNIFNKDKYNVCYRYLVFYGFTAALFLQFTYLELLLRMSAYYWRLLW